MGQPKIAIITDWLVGFGGAERVVLAAHEAFPDAPIYTSVYYPDKIVADKFGGLDIRTTWLQKLPSISRKLYRVLPMLRVKAFRDLDLSEFDIIISFSSAESKQVRKTRPGQVHICYCHTPIRYYWSHYDEYRKDPGLGMLNGLARLAMPIMVPSLKKSDFQAAQNVDVFIANSTEVQKRIKKYYGKSSTVIHPYADMERFKNVSKPINERVGYLAHGRQVPYKRFDLAIQACNDLNLPLIVSGSGGPEHDKLVAMAGETVTFLERPSDEKVAELFGSVKAFLFPAEEDFGIVPVEALAAGTPVIAYASGGIRDIVTNGETGITFRKQTIISLENALKEFEQHSGFEPAKLQRVSKRFSKTLFISKLKKVVADSMNL